jgi:signal peptidase I
MEERPRRPFVAALLSLLVVGLGDAYNGFPGRGARLLAAAVGSGLAIALTWSVVLARTTARSGMMILFLAWAAVPRALRLYGAVRAWRDARWLRDTPPPPGRVRATVVYAVLGLAATLAVAGGIRAFVLQAFKVPSGAMIPTILIGDHVLVNKLVTSPPRPGDVIVFIWPKDRSKDFVKRVVAVEGETIEVRDRHVIVDGLMRDDPHATWTNERSEKEHWGPTTVPAGHVFVMGDNRDQSYDSRVWGSLPLTDIKGKVVVVYWSWDVAHGGVRSERVGHRVD